MFIGQHRNQIEIVPRSAQKPTVWGVVNRAQPMTGYRYKFTSFWEFNIFLVYVKLRDQCRDCGVVAETVPWGKGKHHL
jgi:hypothetical protein